jgi:hypothetical protein
MSRGVCTLQVLPNSGNVELRLDAKFGQEILLTNSREFEDLRRLDRTGGENNLLSGLYSEDRALSVGKREIDAGGNLLTAKLNRAERNETGPGGEIDTRDGRIGNDSEV